VEFFHDEYLMHVLAGQPVWSGDQHLFKLAKGCMIPQPIQTRALEVGTTEAIIAVDVGFRQVPVRLLRHMGQQSFHLLFDGLRLLLSSGRDTGIQGYFHDRPPGCGMNQSTGLPSPTAEGTGRRNPTAVARPGVPQGRG